jgi:hypothetical protein
VTHRHPDLVERGRCAAAVAAVSVEASNKATNTFVFMDASLLSWDFQLPDVTVQLSISNHHPPLVRVSLCKVLRII